MHHQLNRASFVHHEAPLLQSASKLCSEIMDEERLSWRILADKKVVAAFVRPDVSQKTVDTFDEEFAKGRDIGDTWVVHPTRSHGTCTSSLYSETELMGWSVNRWSQRAIKDSYDKVQDRKLWILPLLCDTNWRSHNGRWHRVAWAAGSVVSPKMDVANHSTKFVMFPQRCRHRPYHDSRSLGQR